MLGDPFYLARASYKGEMRCWNHQTLTDEETFRRCHLVLGEHNRYADRMRKHTFLLSGILRCGKCGAPLTASVNACKGKSYYHCPLNRVPHSNAGQNVTVEELDALVGGLLRNVSLTPEAADKIIRYARSVVEQTHSGHDVKRRELSAQQSILEARRSRMETMYLDGAVSEDTYHRQSVEIRESLENIRLEMTRLELGREANIGTFEQLMRVATNAEEAYQKAPVALKRAYLSLFFEKIVIWDRKIAGASLTLAFKTLLDDYFIYDEVVGEQTYLKKSEVPALFSTGTTINEVINSEGWLPSPSALITLLQDATYWNQVRKLLC